MRKVAIYCRVSTDEQAKKKEGSLTSQVQRLQLKVDEKNRKQRNPKVGKGCQNLSRQSLFRKEHQPTRVSKDAF